MSHTQPYTYTRGHLVATTRGTLAMVHDHTRGLSPDPSPPVVTVQRVHQCIPAVFLFFGDTTDNTALHFAEGALPAKPLPDMHPLLI